MTKQADARRKRPHSFHRHVKRAQARSERRRDRLDPECVVLYGRYDGYES